MKRTFKAWIMFVGVACGSVYGNTSETEKWAFFNQKFVKEPETTVMGFLAKYQKEVTVVVCGSMAVYGFGTLLKWQIDEAFEKAKTTLQNATDKANEFRKVAKEAILQLDRREPNKKLNHKDSEIQLPVDELQRQLTCANDLYGTKALLKDVKKLETTLEARKNAARIDPTIFVLGGGLATVLLLHYIKIKHYQYLLKNFITKWNEYRDRVPSIVAEKFDVIVDEYSLAIDKDAYVKKISWSLVSDLKKLADAAASVLPNNL